VILVAIAAGDADRVSEALRAGIGLGLRGDPVDVVLVGAAARFAAGGDRRIDRAIGTLAELGRPVEVIDEAALAARMARARAVELWTDGTTPASARRIQIGGGPPRPVDAADLVAQILASDGPVVVR
jgi:hypothetical protein